MNARARYTALPGQGVTDVSSVSATDPNRVFVSRRRAVGALGVSALGVVLAACSDGPRPAAGGSGSSSSSASPAASSSASASGSASAGASASGSPHYSGKSKAPEGEYRPADFYGPAQNVPKPTTEDGYTNDSLEGMTKAVKAWTQWRNYGLQTGDFKAASQFISKDFKEERDTYDFDSRLYKKGGWIIGGDAHTYEFHGEPINQGDGKYEWKFYMGWPHLIYVESDGKHYKEVLNKDYENNWYMMTLHHDGNQWLIDNVKFLDLKKENNNEE